MARKDVYATDYTKSKLLSPLEAQVLNQYQRLALQLNKLSNEIKLLNTSQGHYNTGTGGSSSEENLDYINSQTSDQLLDNLRNLEMKIGLVYTLFKGAVYSLFLQYEEDQNLKNDKVQRRIDSENESENSNSGEDAHKILSNSGTETEG